MVFRSRDISSPHYPQSNGFIERHLQTVKHTLKKVGPRSDAQIALLMLRATPVDSHLPSPAELLYGRRVVSNLPVATWNASGKRCEIRARLDQRQATAKERHDARGVRDLAERSRGEHIRIRHPVTHGWEPGRIVEKYQQPRSYNVESTSGSVLRRNRRSTCFSAPTMIGSATSVRWLLMTMSMKPETNHCRTTYEILDCRTNRATCDSWFSRASARTCWFVYSQGLCLNELGSRLRKRVTILALDA